MIQFCSSVSFISSVIIIVVLYSFYVVHVRLIGYFASVVSLFCVISECVNQFF